MRWSKLSRGRWQLRFAWLPHVALDGSRLTRVWFERAWYRNGQWAVAHWSEDRCGDMHSYPPSFGGI